MNGNQLRRLGAFLALIASFAVVLLFGSRPLPKTREGGLPLLGDDDAPIRISVETGTRLGTISPLIYGMAQASERHFVELRLPLTRWGGNPATRYNWEKGNCWNAAGDWEFRNGNYNSTLPEQKKPSGCADDAISRVRAHGAQMILTIPTMGWVARDDNTENRSEGVPAKGGDPISPASEAIFGYDPAQNRAKVSQRSVAKKTGKFEDPPNLKDDVVAQDEWAYHLKRKFGDAANGGVRYYAMDNEPDLWAATHRDMHPVRPDSQEILSRFLEYASAIKAVDPTAQITGPVSWGWTGYFFSPRDEGTDNYRTAKDRNLRGGSPFLPWFLKEVAKRDRLTGKRTLDVCDAHFYPQANGVYSGASDEKTNALRLRSTRALWDESYRDESWINEPVNLIPRLRKWIDESYPGTKLGLTEWNWGADETLNGGLAIAEVLGIFGRERVDLACYWTAPKLDTPGFFAYKLFRNADDHGLGFGNVSLKSASDRFDEVSVFGSLDTATGAPVVLLINKNSKSVRKIDFTLSGKFQARKAKAFRYSGEDIKRIVRAQEIVFRSNRAEFTLPASSITLLRCE